MRVLDGGSGWLEPIVISADNKRLAAVDRKQRGIRLFDLFDGSVRRPYKKGVADVCFYPDGEHVVIAARPKSLLLYKWATDTVEVIADANVWSMIVAPDGGLVTRGWSGTSEGMAFDRWSLGADGKFVSERVGSLARFGHCLQLLRYDGSRRVVVFHWPSTQDNRVAILTVPQFRELGSFEGGALPAAVSPVDNQIVSLGARQLRAWDGPDWKACRTIVIPGRHELTGLAYHPSGKRLAVACNDGTVRVFDTTTREEVGKYVWKSGRLRSVTYSADGTLAAAGSDTGKVVVWDVDE
jgi:WD40 repeat protein